MEMKKSCCCNDSQGKEYVDPVCMMSTTDKGEYIPYDYQGTTYYFCNQMCVEKFRQEPEKYIPNLADKSIQAEIAVQPKKAAIREIERYVRAIAGSFILLSLALAWFFSPYWLLFTAFVGLNLLQSAFTKWCLMEDILTRLGVGKKNRQAC
jgi:YHS domain-containing protein